MDKGVFPILVVEDCDFTNMMIEELWTELPANAERVLATSKMEALQILASRQDIRAVFLDWHLPDGTSEGLVNIAYLTQDNVIAVIGTSSNEKIRKQQVLQEGATGQCDKHEIVALSRDLVKSHLHGRS